MGRVGLVALALSVALASAACGRGGAGNEVKIDGRTVESHGKQDVSGEESIEFELDDYYFEPTLMEGEAGQSLELEAFNEGDATHNFTLEEQGIDEDLEAGDETTIEIEVPDSGMVVFFCKYHDDRGMLGALRAK